MYKQELMALRAAHNLLVQVQNVYVVPAGA